MRGENGHANPASNAVCAQMIHPELPNPDDALAGSSIVYEEAVVVGEQKQLRVLLHVLSLLIFDSMYPSMRQGQKHETQMLCHLSDSASEAEKRASCERPICFLLTTGTISGSLIWCCKTGITECMTVKISSMN